MPSDNRASLCCPWTVHEACNLHTHTCTCHAMHTCSCSTGMHAKAACCSDVQHAAGKQMHQQGPTSSERADLRLCALDLVLKRLHCSSMSAAGFLELLLQGLLLCTLICKRLGMLLQRSKVTKELACKSHNGQAVIALETGCSLGSLQALQL